MNQRKILAALNDQGLKLTRQNHKESAFSFFERILTIDPTHTEARQNFERMWQGKELYLSAYQNSSSAYQDALYLLTRNHPDAWRQHEQCYFERSATSDNIVQLAEHNPFWFARLFDKRWNGEQTNHLLISFEQGIGDNIQFMRYLPLAAERCKKVTVCLPPGLDAISERSFPNTNINYSNEWPDRFDHYCLIMSLGYLLDRLDDIPDTPYFKVPSNPPKQSSKPRIGVVWQGNPKHPDDATRSIPYAKIESLFEIEFELVSLEKGSNTWMDTAKILTSLDLVISVDTAVAHMAGALHKPVWLLNRFHSDWRWGLSGDKTPWYPSMRIFRQDRPDDWDSVIHQVKIALCRV